MKGVLAFLVWLFNFWTSFRAFIVIPWVKMCPLGQGRVDPSVRMEQLRSAEGQNDSALAGFLSSLLTDTRLRYMILDNGFHLSTVVDGSQRKLLVDEATHGEFLATIASSKLKSCSTFVVYFGWGIHEVKHMEEIVGSLVTNNNFKIVMFEYDSCSALEMAKSVSKLLTGNKAIENFCLRSRGHETVGKEVAELLANGLCENQVLKALELRIVAHVDDEALEVLLKPLKDNDSVLKSLKCFDILDAGLEQLGVMLGSNTSLSLVSYQPCRNARHSKRGEELYMRGFSSLSKAICINRTLKELECSVRSSMELKVLLEPLMPMNNNPQANATLTTLSLEWSTIGGEEGVDLLTDMICTNTSLLYLCLRKVRELDGGNHDGVENVVAIMEAMKSNKSLKELSLVSCSSVGGYKVLGTMMDMLLENHQLEDIVLMDTPLEYSGDAKYVQHVLERRKEMKLWELIKGMANVSPKSGGVFLCGNPHAGKTTLRTSMRGIYEFRNKQASCSSTTSRRKKILREIFRTSKVPKLPVSRLEMERTRGIEVDHVECDGIGISIWDMAGQTDYHSFHDLVIPNLSADGSCSLFLLTCNPMQMTSFVQKRNISDVKAEIEYWLRFIASNTRRSWQYRPHVSIVMTHHDHWHNEVDFQSRIEEIVLQLQLQFDEMLEFDTKRTIFMVDGEDASCANMVFDFMKTHLKQLLARLPKTIKACSKVQCLIAKWNKEISKHGHGEVYSKLPFLKWDEFSNNICKGVEVLQDGDKELARRKQEFVAISLNDGGHIMYHEEGKFVITNPHWFCHDIMGEFLYRCANMDPKLEMVSAHGIVSIKHVKQILMNIMGSQGHKDLLDATLSMMKKLHMYYEKDEKNIMIPSTLQEKCKRLSWVTMPYSGKLMYVGRRLSCKDAKRTMLSLGFFPRLQVSFFQKFQKNNVGDSYQLSQDVIMFVCDGIEVIIESDHVDMDIMLRSKLCQDNMLEFLENGIVRHIQDMLMNPTLGCPGVILVEGILRPRCVEELVEMKDRKDQFVSMEELRLEVVTCGFDATHNWKECGHLKRGYDEVKDLLGNKAWAKLLEKRRNDLERYREQILQISRRKFQRDSLVVEEGMDSTWRSTIWQVVEKPINLVRSCPKLLLKEVNVKLDNIDQKLDVINRKVDDIFQMQENILKMQNNLLREVSSRIEDLMELSIKMQQSQVPKLAYLSEVGHKKLLTHFIPGLVEFDLHLMCESRDGIHEIVGQEGCKVSFGTIGTRTFMSMLVWGLKMATILTKIGAHVAGGMGGMVPDFGEGLQLAGLIVDTPGVMDEVSAACLKSLPHDIKGGARVTKDDRLKAEKWLIEVLEPKCKEARFYEMFRLRKVVYRGVDSRKGSTAWLCDHCEKNGMQSGMLYSD